MRSPSISAGWCRWWRLTLAAPFRRPGRRRRRRLSRSRRDATSGWSRIAEVIDLSRGGLMRTADPTQRMRGLTISAFVLDGIAAVGFIAMMAFGDGRVSPIDGFVLAALLL